MHICSGSARPALTVACVLRSGGDYDASDVARLREAVARHLTLPHDFVCFADTDVPCARIPLAHGWPGWWAKLEIMRPFAEGGVAGRMFYLDLDTMIVGTIDDLASELRTTILADFYFPSRPASGLMMLTEEARAMVWRDFQGSAERRMAASQRLGDGAVIGQVLQNSERWQAIHPGRVVSYKSSRVYQDGVPEDAAIVCFHGRPRPKEIAWDLATPRPPAPGWSLPPSSGRAEA